MPPGRLSLGADGPAPIPDAREIEVRGAPVRLTVTPLSAGHSLLSVSGSTPADAAAAFCLTLPRARVEE
ncbi:MAG: hypothetical protein ACP5C4_06025 [Methanomicrobiales archaeon]